MLPLLRTVKLIAIYDARTRAGPPSILSINSTYELYILTAWAELYVTFTLS